MTKKEIKALSNQDLLNKYSYYQSWFGDDYSLYLPENKDYIDAQKIEKEILERMEGV